MVTMMTISQVLAKLAFLNVQPVQLDHLVIHVKVTEWAASVYVNPVTLMIILQFYANHANSNVRHVRIPLLA